MTAAPKSAELLACPLCKQMPKRNGRFGKGGVVCIGDASVVGMVHRFQTYGADQDEADAAWNRAAQTPAAVEGWKLVPVEPTEAMQAAWNEAFWRKQGDCMSPQPTEHPDDGGGPFGYGYRAMLSASPTPPAAGAEDGRVRWASNADPVGEMAIHLSATANAAEEENGEWTWREIAAAAIRLLPQEPSA